MRPYNKGRGGRGRGFPRGRDNFQGSSQCHNWPAPPPHYQGPSNVQQTSWTPQVPPAMLQFFDKPNAGGYNQIGFNYKRPEPEQDMVPDGGYKDYDNGDRRFPPQRDENPGINPPRLSPGSSGRLKTPPPPGTSMSPPVEMRWSVEDNEEDSADSSQDSSVTKELVDSNVDDEENQTENNEDEKDVVCYRNEVEKILKSISGAARRRYKALIADNVPWRKALEMCQKGWSRLPPEANPRKRKHLLKMDKNKTRIDTTTARTHSGFENKNHGLKSGQCAEVRIENETYMTRAQSHILLECLNTKIMEASKGEGPRFNGYGYQSGILTMSCKDKQSQLWLLDKVTQIEPWPAAKLTATIVRLPPRRMIVSAVLPESEITDVGHAFRLFKLQNRGLNTEEWVHKSTEKVKGGMNVIIDIDQRSAVALEESHFQACLGLETVHFNKLFKPPERKAAKLKAKKFKHA